MLETTLAARRQRKEGQQRRAGKIAGPQKASWPRRNAGRVASARLAEIVGEQLGPRQCQLLVGGHLGVERGEEREPGALRLATRARLGLCQGLLRPCPKRELQQRQVDQPFAGIVDDVEMNPAMAERAPQGVAGGVLDAETQLTDLDRKSTR